MDSLLVWEMDSQGIDSWLFSMHWELKYMPATLYGRNIVSIYIFFDFIDCLLTLPCDLRGCVVVTFIDVFVDVFNGFDRCTNFHIDVTVYIKCKVHIRSS